MDNKHSPNPVLNRYVLWLQAFRFQVEWIPGLRMSADTFSRLVVVVDGEFAYDVRHTPHARASYSDLVFGSLSPAAPVACLYTWSPSNLALPEPSYGFTSVLTSIPHDHVESIGLTALPTAVDAIATEEDNSVVLEDTPPEDSTVISGDAQPASDDTSPPAAVEVGNVNTFEDTSYSPKDRMKLQALLHLRDFFTQGLVPTGKLGNWVKWLAKRLTFDGTTIWRLEGSLKLKVLESPASMLSILRELHDGLGHRGLAAVFHHFRLRFWIPAAVKVIRQYIMGCSACQHLSAPNKFEVPGYQVQPNDIFSHWSIDCIGPFPADPRTGDLHVIIAVDWLSRWAEARAINSTDAATCSDFIYSDICCRYGVPESIRSDHSSGFDNEILDHLASTLRVNHHLSTPYYPQSNGLVERTVQTFKNALKCLIQDQLAGADGEAAELSSYWSHLVPSVLFAYRTSPHTSLGMSPAELVFGRSLRLPGDHTFPPVSGS